MSSFLGFILTVARLQHPEAKQRHPWISWQNRYKKAIKHFNKQIDHYGEWYPQVHLDGYSQDPRSDAMNRNSRTRVSAVGRRRAANVDHDTDEEAGPPVQNNRAALVQTRIRPHRGRQVPETESEDDEPQEVSPPPPPTQNEFEAANQHDYESLGEDNGQYDPSETSEDAQGIVNTHEFENGIPGNSTSTPPRIVEQTSPLSTQATVVNFREQILKAASQIKAPQYDVFPSDEENEEGGILLQKRPVYHTELPHIDMNDHRHKKARRSNARPLPNTQITLIHDEENHTPARSFRFDGTSRRKGELSLQPLISNLTDNLQLHPTSPTGLSAQRQRVSFPLSLPPNAVDLVDLRQTILHTFVIINALFCI